jgi:glycerol kinase
MVNIGEEPKDAPEGLVTSVGFAALGKTFYAYEGNIHCTGATIKWLVEKLELIESPQEIEAQAISVADNGGVYFVPAFAGLGAPWWADNARAIIYGMTLGTTKAHILRAALEAIAYQVKDLVDLMTGQAEVSLKELRVDGGATHNKFLMQFQADMVNAIINRSDIEETSALGAMIMNGFARGLWHSFDEVSAMRTTNHRVIPQMDGNQRNEFYLGWLKAIKKVI